MVSIGSHYGVAFLMGKWHLSGFFAMLMKHIVNIKYFLEIFSLYYAIQYVFHEFFHIKNRRNIFRGHLSRYGNVLWSVPLRLFYGGMWTIEGLKKIFGLWGASSWIDGSHFSIPVPLVNRSNNCSKWCSRTVTASRVAQQKLQRKQQLKSFHSVLTIRMVNNQQWSSKKCQTGSHPSCKSMIPNVEVAHLMQKGDVIRRISYRFSNHGWFLNMDRECR